ncbi:TetR family transcriptional regulator [Belnapia sp. T6]|uniref:TetR family transcriptional regulator n=1 Tax=Belnapia mucosa TaxID=2804532 RepID=A0ABS1UX89_9PROT|nr:TetR family transcriptional regulator [Belnapia mucosa]MBL6454076.1 TetR family transcriptional regulator [Belnapia mucosa]
MSEMQDTETRLVAGLWQVVAAHGWAGLSMRRVAAASGVAPAEIRRRCPTPHHLLLLHGRLVDQAVLEGVVPDAPDDNTPRDRVFDVMMRRIDALQPHRAGILRFMDDLRGDPLLALALLAALPGSMAWMLEAAGLGAGGIAGLARAKGLTAVWLAVLRAWAGDESADLGPTMAALDRALDRAERLARALRLEPGETARG